MSRNTFKFSLIVMLFASSCQEYDNSQAIDDLAIAKEWFAGIQSKLISHKRAGSQRLNIFSKQPDWNRYKVYRMKNGRKAIEVALDYENNLIFSTERLASQNPKVYNSMLLVEIRPQEFALFIVKSYPENDANYSFDEINLNNIPPNFSGNMIVFDWYENMIGGWKIEFGEKTMFYHQINKGGGIDSGKTNEIYCYLLVTTWYSQACTIGGDCAPPVQIDETSTMMCEYSLAPGDSYGGGGPGDPDANTCFTEHPFIQGLLVPCADLAIITNNVTNPCIS